MNLENKRILVTGCGGGIGSAICRKLKAEGAEVIATDLDANGADLAAELELEYHSLDVTSEASWQSVTSRLQQDHGSLDGLVNNAGIILLRWICYGRGPRPVQLRRWFHTQVKM